MIPILILWIAYGLRLYQLDFQSIWWDEGHSIFVASHPVLEIPTLPAMDVHPPAYFAALHGWIGLVGQSEFSLRYLSVIFSLLTIALLWRFAAYLGATIATPGATTLLAALSPMYVAYAQEVRSYAMITFLALASTFVLWQLLFPKNHQDTPRKRGLLLLLYVVLTAGCLYTHYFTIFLLIFHNMMALIWILRGRFALNHNARTLLVHTGLWIAAQIGVLLLFAPQLLLAAQQITSYTNPNLAPPPLAQFIRQSWQAYTVGLTIEATPAWWGMAAIAASLVVGWSIQLTVNRRRIALTFWLLLLWLLVPLAGYFIILQRQPSFEPRYLILITPALFLLLGLGLTPLFNEGGNSTLARNVLRFTLYALIVLILGLGLYSYYTNQTFFKDDSAGVAAWLAGETTPNDIVYVDVPHPFHYYANQGSIPAPVRYFFVDIHTAANRLNREAAGRDRLFWITWRGSDTDPRGVVPFLAEKAGEPEGQREFRGYQVQWFSLPNKEDLLFNLPDILTPTHTVFGDVLRLDGIAHAAPAIPSDEPIWATLHFTLLRNTEVNYRVSLRLRDEAGRLVSQVDRDLLNDRHFQTSAWPVNDPALNQAINVYLLPVPAETPPGRYRLEVVVYNAEPPYPSEGVSSDATQDGVSAVIGDITVLPTNVGF